MKRYAILISCEEYTNYSNISFCHSDNYLMEETLSKNCDYDTDNILQLILYPDGESNAPEKIFSQITKFISNSSPEDTLLFYFAGHGLISDDIGYLLLPESKENDLENTAISLNKLNKYLTSNKKCNFRIFDACHSGFDCRGNNTISFSNLPEQEGWITLASCSKDENSYPDSSLEQGIFTYCLAESIKEFDENTLIYAEHLKIKICDKMSLWCEKEVKKQTPTLNASITGNVSIAEKKTVSTTLSPDIINIPEIITDISDSFIAPSSTIVSEIAIGDSSNHYLWESPSGVLLPKRADVETILNYNLQLKPKEIIQITQTYNSDFFEMAAEFIWTRAMNLLRKKVTSLGVDFVADMIEINNSDYIYNLPPFEVINLAYELGFIDKTGKMRLRHASETIQMYSEQSTNEEMTEDQLKEILRVCIQYILGQDDSNVNLEYNNFRDRLKLESIDELQLDMILNSPYFYKKTTTRTLMNLLKETDGAEFSNVSSNILLIIPYIWEFLLSEEKYFIATTYAKYANDGNTKYTIVLKNVLMKVQGFDYVPENLKSLTFIETAQKLISTHHNINNFYNEPKATKDLASLGTIIPKPALKIVINATLLIKLGNSYGISHAAQKYADNILDSIRLEQWKCYLELYLQSSENILWSIMHNRPQIQRWINLVEKYDLNSLEITAPLIKPLLEKTKAKDFTQISALAQKIYALID